MSRSDPRPGSRIIATPQDTSSKGSEDVARLDRTRGHRGVAGHDQRARRSRTAVGPERRGRRAHRPGRDGRPAASRTYAPGLHARRRHQQRRVARRAEHAVRPGRGRLPAARPRRPRRAYEIQSGYPAKVAAELGCSEEAVRQRQTVTDTLAIASVLSAREPDELDYYRDAYEPTVQAMDTATTAEGTEWVPRAFGQLVERVNLNLLVGALFDQVEMPARRRSTFRAWPSAGSAPGRRPRKLRTPGRASSPSSRRRRGRSR